MRQDEQASERKAREMVGRPELAIGERRMLSGGRRGGRRGGVEGKEPRAEEREHKSERGGCAGERSPGKGGKSMMKSSDVVFPVSPLFLAIGGGGGREEGMRC